ncbi:hypothetical protein ACO22_07275 [Paracoccidioides brasiliensis]|uniref:Uncharacterized protein n=1 Tax=Paracoccidioides brasiliensis TaxID=121759 RepID=A0A1D2J560_PARBR|nr:hypothetical protein ACO22_07275 [Paracoccidioides brasiliensis]
MSFAAEHIQALTTHQGGVKREILHFNCSMVDTPISATTPSSIIHGSGSDSLPEEFRMESGRSVIEKSRPIPLKKDPETA